MILQIKLPTLTLNPLTCVDHLNEIVMAVFQFINMLQREGPKQWIYQECSVSSRVCVVYACLVLCSVCSVCTVCVVCCV